jgi:hypothetical protein
MPIQTLRVSATFSTELSCVGIGVAMGDTPPCGSAESIRQSGRKILQTGHGPEYAVSHVVEHDKNIREKQTQ